MVESIIYKYNLDGKVLDFGAGQGNLSRLLHSMKRFEEIHCVDIMHRPKDLDQSILWYQQDLNYEFTNQAKYKVIFCVEVIEHLENPRAVFRNFKDLLEPDGFIVLTTPNQHSIRSKFSYLFGGHFAGFRGSSYPAHITALLKLDLERICLETGLEKPKFFYSNEGGIPKMPHITWQKISKIFKSSLFSDNIGMVCSIVKQ